MDKPKRKGNSSANGQRDEPPPVGGGNFMLIQVSVPTDRAELKPKGIGSSEFDGLRAKGAPLIRSITRE